MALVRTLRILLALLLLGAQQLALAHQLWHVGKHGPQPVQEQLCDQHEALGTVAGAVDAAAPPPADDAADFFPIATAALPAAATRAPAPSSRGPPALF